MSEYQNPEQTLPEHLQQPPVLSELEVQALQEAQAVIAHSRSVPDDKAPFHEYVMGVTYDGVVVSVDERDHGVDDRFAVRVGTLSELVAGTPLSEERLPYGLGGGMRMRDGGTTTLRSGHGIIAVAAPQFEELPGLEDKLLFPIGKDGQPFSPADKQVAESVQAEQIARHETETVQAQQVSVGGLRKFFGRRK